MVVSEFVSHWKSQWGSESVNKPMIGHVNEPLSEPASGTINEWANEYAMYQSIWVSRPLHVHVDIWNTRNVVAPIGKHSK